MRKVKKALAASFKARRVLFLCQFQEWLADELAADVVDCGGEVLVGGLCGDGLECRGNRGSGCYVSANTDCIAAAGLDLLDD